MSETSLILSLPYIQPAQAQKHVTHNEALRALDVIVQPTVLEVGPTTPPAAPAQGARYVVGPGATGAWAGQDHSIAVWEDAGWTFHAPKTGWSTRATDTLAEWVFDGAEWALPATNASELGINTTADSTNRLSVSAPATLLSHEGAGHQLKINKADISDTASLLYQTNWSGRAEMGTTGSDDFEIKVSADGTTWNTGLHVDAGTGVAQFPSGVRVPHRSEIGGRWICYTDQRWITVSRAIGLGGDAHTGGSGTGAEPPITWMDTGLFMPAGTVIESLTGRLRPDGSESASVTSYSLRLFFQYGPTTPDGNGWNSVPETSRDLVFGADDVTLLDGWQSLAASFPAYTAPRDGALLMYLKPGGSYTTQQSIVTEMVAGYVL